MENLYTIQEFKKPTFFQKLFNVAPKENAIVEINNLLATKPINEIHVEEIEAISSKYRVNLYKKYSSNLKQLYLPYVKKCCEDNILHPQELNELNMLRLILVLSRNDADELLNTVASEIYKKYYDNALRDGVLENSEEEFIDNLQLNLRLGEDIAFKISKDSRKQLVDLHLNKVIEDGRISPDEWEELTSIAKNINVQIDKNSATKAQLEKMKLFWLIENAELPVKQVNISLQKNEQCYFYIDTEWLENRTVTKRINYGGPVLRVKIMKNIYYRAGSLEVQRITSDVLSTIDNGITYVTNKRLIFVGGKKNANIPLSKILSLTPYSDGVGIEKDSGKSPILRVSDNADIFAMIIGRLINEL